MKHAYSKSAFNKLLANMSPLHTCTTKLKLKNPRLRQYLIYSEYIKYTTILNLNLLLKLHMDWAKECVISTQVTVVSDHQSMYEMNTLVSS